MEVDMTGIEECLKLPQVKTTYMTHTWSEKSNYTVIVKAKDVFDKESDLATLEVSMPKNSAICTPFFSILKNHPHMFPILRYILEL